LESYIHTYFRKNKVLGEWYSINTCDIDNIINVIDMNIDLDKLQYKQLQLLAKINGIRANKSKNEIIQCINKKCNGESIETQYKKIDNNSSCIIL